MQYERIFGRGRPIRALLIGLVLCFGATTDAQAGKNHARNAAHHRTQRTTDDGISSSSRYAAIVIDDKTGKVLFAKNADAPRHPASLTKMMTLYLLFEDLKKGKVNLTGRFTASAKASAQPPTKLGLRPGQTIMVEDAIKALVTESANDAAVTIAENLGGSEAGFAKRMTATARKLGMKGSVFYNASGLPNDAQFTTARDMVILGRALQERFPTYYRYFSTRSFVWGGSIHANHNHLMSRIEGIDGIKTGYTNASGFNLVTSYRRDGRHIVAAVMGGSSARSRDDHMARLLATWMPQASTGGKVSSVFDESGSQRAAAEDDAEETVAAAVETPAPPPPRPLPLAYAAPDPVIAPAPEPTRAPIATETASRSAPMDLSPNRPRIAASDVVVIQPQERNTRTSSDHGAAVAMARAILLPDAGRPMRPTAEAAPAPVRTASNAPVAMPMPQRAPEPPVVKTVATTVVTVPQPAPRAEPRPEPIVTASVPKIKEAAPVAPARREVSGWVVQIGAYDNDKAARAALDKAKSKAGGVLARVEAYTEQATTGSGHVWRARYAGFADQKRADDACKALRRQQFACLALRQ